MKNVFDLPHVKSVRAWALMHDGKLAGRIVANWSDNPNGSVCQAAVMVWAGPLGDLRTPPKNGETLGDIPQGRAGGSGYCKFSAAIDQALRKAGQDTGDMNGAGESAVEAWLDSRGYKALKIV